MVPPQSENASYAPENKDFSKSKIEPVRPGYTNGFREISRARERHLKTTIITQLFFTLISPLYF